MPASPFLNYSSEKHGDKLNTEFRVVLYDTPEFKSMAHDTFLFYTEAYYQRHLEMRISKSKTRNPNFSWEDEERITSEINEQKNIFPVNSGEIELAYQDEMSFKINQLAISFIEKNAKYVDYISGLKKAKAVGYEILTTYSYLEFGKPVLLKV